MDWIYELAQPFIWKAERALGVGLGLLAAYGLTRAARARRPGLRPRPLLVAAAAWLVFAGLEAEAERERADLRVDLLLTWPALCAVTAVCVGLWAHGLVRRARP